MLIKGKLFKWRVVPIRYFVILLLLFLLLLLCKCTRCGDVKYEERLSVRVCTRVYVCLLVQPDASVFCVSHLVWKEREISNVLYTYYIKYKRTTISKRLLFYLGPKYVTSLTKSSVVSFFPTPVPLGVFLSKS